MKSPRKYTVTPAALLILLIAWCWTTIHGALPPGYEDVMWCPTGYCDRYIQYSNGLVGPQHLFHECYNPGTGSVMDEVWTGSLTDVEAPEDWVESPTECEEPKLVTDYPQNPINNNPSTEDDVTDPPSTEDDVADPPSNEDVTDSPLTEDVADHPSNEDVTDPPSSTEDLTSSADPPSAEDVDSTTTSGITNSALEEEDEEEEEDSSATDVSANTLVSVVAAFGGIAVILS